ncbi:MAG TPA: lamin tail domain-containing protein [Anaerolineales bacterium]
MKKRLLVFALLLLSLIVGVKDVLPMVTSGVLALAGDLEPRLYLPLIYRPPSIPTATPIPTPTATWTPTAPPTHTKTPLPSATPTRTNTPLPSTTPTKTLTPTTQPGNVQITGIHELDSEYVAIQNQGGQAVQLLNWTLRDIANHVYTCPSFVIQPGQVCRIYTNENHPEWCGFNYESGSPIWNNDGDCAYLRNEQNGLIDTFCY